MGIPLVTEVVDFFAALVSGRDISTVRGPTLFVVLHSVLLGCLCRPRVDARPDGKGSRHWLASLALFLTYILGGTTVTAVLLGSRPCWMVSDSVWLFYALGWLLAGLLPVRRLVLQSPAKVCSTIILLRTQACSQLPPCLSGGLCGRPRPHARVLCERRGRCCRHRVPARAACCRLCPRLQQPRHGLAHRARLPCARGPAPCPLHRLALALPVCLPVLRFPLLNTCHLALSLPPHRGLQNTFWAALGYYVLSGRPWGAGAPTGLRARLANVALVVPLVVDAVANLCLGLGVCAWGPVARLVGRGVAQVHRARDAVNRACEQAIDHASPRSSSSSSSSSSSTRRKTGDLEVVAAAKDD